MNLKRTTIVLVGGAAFAAWLSAEVGPGRPPIATVRIAPAPIDAGGAALADEIARLRERLYPDPAPSDPVRNPFVFRQAGQGVSTSSLVPDAAEAAANDKTPRLRLRLTGLAEELNPAGGPPMRTAIISGSGQVFLAKEGDTVADGDVEYAVRSITEGGVELIDSRDGTTRQLTLD